MRTRNDRLIALLALALAGCVPSSGVVVHQPPAPRPVPVVIVEPLEVDIARPHNGKLFVQTNRAAYVAIFEIVPERGITMVYPQSARQRRFVVSGLRDLPVWWEPSRATYHGAGQSSSRSYRARYIYVLASDEPLRIPDAAFQDGYFYEALGKRDYRSRNPYATMRALARELVPPVADEDWAEDAYELSPSYATERYRVTRVYCRGGRMYEVPSELADHVWCPTYARQAMDGPGRVSEVDVPGSRRPLVRPDSVVGDNGVRLAVRARGSNGRGPIDRVKEPAGWENRGNDRDEDDDRQGNGRGKDHQENGSDGRARKPNDRHDDAPPGQQRPAEKKEAMRLPPRPAPMPMPVLEPTKGESRDSSATPETVVKPDSTVDTKSESKSETKSQGQGGKGTGPAKGRGRPNASDEKPSDRKPKPSADTKPVS